jgi:hypothetical protein
MSDIPERIETNPDTAYETADWPIGMIGLVLAGVLAVLAIAVVAVSFGFSDAVSDARRSLATPMPEPRLQTDPPDDLAKLRAREQKELDTYYWIDRDKGIVHIPIDEAMKQVVARGIDGFPQGKP